MLLYTRMEIRVKSSIIKLNEYIQLEIDGWIDLSSLRDEEKER